MRVLVKMTRLAMISACMVEVMVGGGDGICVEGIYSGGVALLRAREVVT